MSGLCQSYVDKGCLIDGECWPEGAVNPVNDCLTCQAGYQFVDQGFGDCTGTCEPLLDNSAHYVAGMNL